MGFVLIMLDILVGRGYCKFVAFFQAVFFRIMIKLFVLGTKFIVIIVNLGLPVYANMPPSYLYY